MWGVGGGGQILLPFHFISFSCVWRLPARTGRMFLLVQLVGGLHPRHKIRPEWYLTLTILHLLPFQKRRTAFLCQAFRELVGQQSQGPAWAGSLQPSCLLPVRPVSPSSLSRRCEAADPVQTCGKVHRAPVVHPGPFPLTGEGTPSRKASLD